MKYSTDLILSEVFCIFIFFHFLDSGLPVLNGLHFYFRWRDSENRMKMIFLLPLRARPCHPSSQKATDMRECTGTVEW